MKVTGEHIALELHEVENAGLTYAFIPVRDGLLVAEDLDEEARIAQGLWEIAGNEGSTFEIVSKHIAAEQIRTCADLELGLQGLYGTE